MEGVRLVLNADDPLVAQMSRSTGLQSVFYGLARHGGVTRQGAAAREAKFCPLCGRELAYRFYHYSQLGSYSCPGCGFARPDPDVEGDSPRLGGAHTQCRVKFRLGSAVSLEVPVYGLYNLYNALAAYTTALLLNVDPLEAAGFLKGYRPATGRMERFDYRGKPVYLNLVKNPTGFNEGIGALVEMSRPDLDVMIAINDNDADGRDISWLWDVDFELLADCQERIGKFVCAGSRAGEMALRLKYAGVGESRLVVEEDFNEAVSGVLGGGAGKACILATYTALWPVERILSGHAKRDYTQADHMPHVS
jgi:UDP-N-acetylmuramyl tripeptide synthase